MDIKLDEFLQISIIAIIQGFTEFLPISSSGHLILISEIGDFSKKGIEIEVAAHIGSLFAVIFYFRRIVFRLSKTIFSNFASLLGNNFRDIGDKKKYEDANLVRCLIVGCLPILVIGFLIVQTNISILRLLITIGIGNLFFALILFHADRIGSSSKTLSGINVKDALIIGFFQIFALIPGSSRSGVTISMARYLGYDRTSATEYSLLSGIPVITAAGVLQIIKIVLSDVTYNIAPIILVCVLSFVVALSSIRFLLLWVEKTDFKVFVIYRLILGIFLIGLAIL